MNPSSRPLEAWLLPRNTSGANSVKGIRSRAVLFMLLGFCCGMASAADENQTAYKVPDQAFKADAETLLLAPFDGQLHASASGGAGEEGLLVSGEPAFEDGKFGRAFLAADKGTGILSYDGVGSSLRSEESGTVEFWFRCTDSPADPGENPYPPLWCAFFTEAKTGLGMTLVRSNPSSTGIALYFQSPDDYIALSGQLWEDDWNHVAFTWNGSKVSLFVNGALAQTAELPRPVSEWWGGELVIGSNQFKLAVPFGLFDDLRISRKERY